MTTRSTTTDAEHRDLARGLGAGLERTYLVEAGAGTGKTTVLVDRLLSIVRAGTSISRIAAITFTEKAAGELRIRLRGDLESAAGAADGQERELLEGALREIDRAQVGTIHAFCTGLLKERPVEAGVDPDFAIADELRRTVLLDSAWDTWLREELAGDLPRAVSEARALGLGIERVRALALKLVDQRDLLDLVPEPVEPGDTEALIIDLRAEAHRFAQLATAHCAHPEDKAAAAIEEFVVAVESLDLLPESSRVAHALTQIQPRPGKNCGRKGNWDDGILAELRDRAARLRERQKQLRERASHNAAVGLLRWLAGYIEAYQREKSRAGLLDFQDLLVKARDLLKGNADVRQHFKRAYDRVLVDEFQDTDPLQCEIVFYISEKQGKRAPDWTSVDLEPGKLFIVGDPKQSIYRFRRADIETYEQAKEIVSADGAVLELVENFRTRPVIIDEINTVFSPIMRAPEDGRRYQSEYEALAAHRDRDGRGPGVFVLTPPAPIDKKASAASVREAEARTVAAFITRALETGTPEVFDKSTEAWRPVRLRDIAVLFHRTTALDAYENALNAYGLDYRIAGGKKFYVRREVKELTTVLTAVEDPHNLVAVVGALRTPFLGVSDEAIVLHRRATGTLNYLAPSGLGVVEVEEAFALLRKLHGERNSNGIARLILTLFEETAALELFLLKPTGEQRYANLIKVVELASSLEKTEPMSFGGFVRWLRDVSQLTPEEAESPLSEEGDEFVRMLTIHKAKGLEFPVTVLADLGHLRKHGEEIIVDREQSLLEFGIGRHEHRLATLGYKALSELEDKRRDAGLMRLLYVGTTRARDALVVPWFVKEGDDRGLLCHLAALNDRVGEDGADVGVLKPDTGALDLERRTRRPIRLNIGEARALDHTTTEAHAEREEWLSQLSGFGDSHERPEDLVAPSSLAHGAEGEPARDPDEHVAPTTGTRFGTLVHALMERLDFETPEEAERVARAIARTAGLPEEMVPEAASLAAEALGSEILGRARAARSVFREVPFCLSRGQTMLEGKIDLLFEEEHGLVVVDYKTDRIPPGGVRELAERYRNQATVYGIAAGLAAGRPVKEVVLLFMRGRHEESIHLDPDPGARDRILDEIVRSPRVPHT